MNDNTDLYIRLDRILVKINHLKAYLSNVILTCITFTWILLIIHHLNHPAP